MAVKRNPKKMTAKKYPGFIEKKTGEHYTSKAAMKKHESHESSAVRFKEYGNKRGR